MHVLRPLQVVLSGALVMATSWQAHANSAGPPLCGVIVLAPRVEQGVPEVVPSNAPAFALARSFDSQQPRLFDAGEREIGVVQTTIDGIEVYAAASALREGPYNVEFGGPCQDSPRRRVPFRVGAPVPFPKTSGRLTVEGARRLAEASNTVEISVAVEPETSAYASYARFSYGVVGQPESRSEFGGVRSRERPIVSIRATCGRQTLQVKQRIAGLDASAIASTELAVDVDCANDALRVAGKDPLPIAAVPPPGGCHVGPGPSRTGVAALGLALACAAIVRRRKRAG